ncbi:ATP-dependent DNA helicase RecG [Corynebacterium glucuronolyticum]|uniref:ATP-dependent DNA helicase RecG n=1 Tax=Corynebacterium glucuronolyticum TaxID=39791 RepID=UPI00191ED049|nr:ATP-dependent DNA helicase RecG [Corynebacterium glucuronolyticum]QQU87484.1 ATP-dependent DNA helicase RecG [Corynebacterium glucuronolyticum]
MLGWKDSRPLTDLLPATECRALKKNFGITSVPELLLNYPRRYIDSAQGTALIGAQDGDIVTAIGTITRTWSTTTRKGMKIFHVTVDDGGVEVTCVFFNSAYLSHVLIEGSRVLVTGKVKSYQGKPQLSHPGFLVLNSTHKGTGQIKELSKYPDAEGILRRLTASPWTPIYRGTSSFPSMRMWAATSEVLRQTPHIPEPLGTPPEEMVDFDTMLRGMHVPSTVSPYACEQRARYNEALSLSLVMALLRDDQSHRRAHPCAPLDDGGSRRQQFIENLPYTLTDGQQSVVQEISSDLAKPTPMSRLLQGEVGSGKTVVALISMLQVIDAGHQTAFLAPTEVLAQQHARSLTQLLGAVPARVVCLTGSMTVAQKKDALLKTISGEADIVVGTHALIQDTVEFFDLGMVIVDEQHRFGVEQRDMLRNRGTNGITPHLLAMTATPIPRTIAITAFGDLEVSLLTELPGGRKPIRSAVVFEGNDAWMNRAWERIREEVQQGHQAFIVCPRIDGPGGVEEVYELLEGQIYPDLAVALLHGKLHPDDKEEIMTAFGKGQIDILVSTTVIEVGINVPNATIMMVRESENFGVSQLHQLRGRIGRGGYESWCLFHTLALPDSEQYARLCAIANTNDGYTLATLDLETRQEGDIIGTSQSGSRKQVRLLSFVRDGELIEHANKHADELVHADRILAEELVADIGSNVAEYLEKS